MRTGFVWGLLAKAVPDTVHGSGPGLDRRQVLAGIAAMGLAPSLIGIEPAEARTQRSRVAIIGAGLAGLVALDWSPPVLMRRSTRRAGVSADVC